MNCQHIISNFILSRQILYVYSRLRLQIFYLHKSKPLCFGPAFVLSFAASIDSIQSSGQIPRPIFIKVPTMIRTILYRKPFPLILICIISPTLSMVISVIVRTVFSTCDLVEQKLLKSCSPTRTAQLVSSYLYQADNRRMSSKDAPSAYQIFCLISCIHMS